MILIMGCTLNTTPSPPTDDIEAFLPTRFVPPTYTPIPSITPTRTPRPTATPSPTPSPTPTITPVIAPTPVRVNNPPSVTGMS
ncbi:MAG TPA: hypothetical protein PLZ51_00295 [Aggregatilineales bacterium]|nr:hypothetical protein [Aggregatilineales bacterium]